MFSNRISLKHSHAFVIISFLPDGRGLHNLL